MIPAKTPIHRLKLSSSMVGLSFRRTPIGHRLKDVLCQRFAGNGINLTFITTQRVAGEENLFCCLIDADWHHAEPLIERPGLYSGPRFRIHPAVSLLSVFPHQSDIGLVAWLLHTLWTMEIPVRAAASSIAALTLVVDTDRITPHAADLERRLGIHPQGSQKG